MPAPILKEHKVTLESKIPANAGDMVTLPVREYDGTKPNHPHQPVLMLHGRSVPALAGFDLAPVPGGLATRYSWAQELADDGYDVFIMDLQGSGRSPRPRMDDPCNANPVQQPVLVPNPLQAPCPPPPPYPHQLGNSESEWAEVDAVVEYIRGLPGRKKPIRFIAWSLGAAIMGPYTLQHPGNVESLLLLAPVFPPNGRWSDKPDDPFGRPAEAQTLPMSKPSVTWGFPMFVGTRTGFRTGLDGNPDLREPGVVDLAWEACMRSDPLGSKWGPEVAPGEYEGILRYRNTYWWGWNNRTVPHENPAGTPVLGNRIPVLIVYGERDRAANSPATFPDPIRFSVPDLYKAVKGPRKLMFCLEGAGHSLVWEITAKTVHHMSKQWFKNGKVEGQSSGSFFRDSNGELIPL